METQNKPNTLVLDLIKGGVLLFLIVVLVIALARSDNTTPPVSALLTPGRTPAGPGSAGTMLPGTILPPLTPGALAVVPPVISADGSVTFSGTGPAGSTIEIWANGEKVGVVTVSAGGTWVYEAQPPPGDYQVVVVTRDSDGTVVDQTSPVGLTVLPSAGTTAPGSSATPVPGTTAPPAPTISEAAVSETGEVVITGTGTPGSTVVIYEDGVAAATAVVGEDGTFEVTYQSTSGEHVFVAQPEVASPPGSSGQATPTGPASTATPPATSVQATPTPAQPTPTPTLIPIPTGGLAYVVQPGDGLMELARRYYGDPARWVDIFVATNAKAYQDPSFAVLTNPNFIVAGWKIFIPEG